MNRSDSEYKKMWKSYLREEKEPMEAKLMPALWKDIKIKSFFGIIYN